MWEPDLQPLGTPVGRDEIAQWRAAARKRKAAWARVPLTPVIALGLLAGTYAIFVVLMTIAAFRNPPGPAEIAAFGLTLAIPGTLLAVVMVLLVRVAVRPWQRWMRLLKFAAANGMTFTPEAVAPNHPGALFQAGQHRRVTEHLRRTTHPHLELGNYRAMFGSGKGRHTRTWGYLAMRLERALPHMLLDARANNILATTGLPFSLRTDQVLSVEGDFDTYFTLYCPREYERDALEVFQPDLMALLIDEAAPFDVEVVDDWLFAYSRRPLRLDDPDTMRRLFRIGDTVAERTRKRSARYRDTRAAVSGTIAEPGRRLRRRIPPGAVIAGVTIALLWVVSFGIPLLADILR